MESSPAACRDGDEDLISALPDNLLLTILLCLQSGEAAARTSVLSRRWRRVWTYLPELDLVGSPDPATKTSSAARLDAVDAAINSHSAPTLHRLKIDVSNIARCKVPAHRVAPWLLFASQRVTGRIDINLPSREPKAKQVALEDLALPVCRATDVDIKLGNNFVLRPPPTGSFTALTDMTIMSIEMDGGELGRFISMQCPRLRKLCLFGIRFIPTTTSPVSIRSESLERLQYFGLSEGKLEVTTPMLLEISVHRLAEAYIVAPKLEKVKWSGKHDPGRHQFAVAPRHLRSLSIMYSTWLNMLISSKWLMQRFSTVSEMLLLEF